MGEFYLVTFKMFYTNWISSNFKLEAIAQTSVYLKILFFISWLPMHKFWLHIHILKNPSTLHRIELGLVTFEWVFSFSFEIWQHLLIWQSSRQYSSTYINHRITNCRLNKLNWTTQVLLFWCPLLSSGHIHPEGSPDSQNIELRKNVLNLLFYLSISS